MSALEQQYRAVLRWYPRTWRDENADVVVGTLLDVAEDDGHDRARISEMANLAINGLLARMRMLPAIVPSAVRDRTATGALAAGAAISLTAMMQLESSPHRHAHVFSGDIATFGPFASPAILVYVVWLVALLASVAGFTLTSRWLTALTIPVAVTTRIVADATEMLLRPTWTFYALLLVLAILATLGNPASGRAGIRWLLLWFVPLTGVFLLPQLTSHVAFQDPLWLDVPTWLSWSPLIAFLAAVTFRLFGHSSWSVAVLILGLPFTAASLSGMGNRAFHEVAEIALLIAIAIIGALILLRLLGLRVRIQRAR
jgi:hypothetical protein